MTGMFLLLTTSLFLPERSLNILLVLFLIGSCLSLLKNMFAGYDALVAQVVVCDYTRHSCPRTTIIDYIYL